MFLANQKPTHPKWRFPAVFATMLCLVLPASRLAADEATRWNEVTAKASFDSGFANYPIPDSRLYAMVHAAVHDALNSIDHRYKLYLPGPTVTPDASPQAAVATAAHDVLVDQFNQLIGFGFPSQLSAIESAYAASLAAIPDTPAKMKGIALGKATAMAILKLRAGDVWNPAALVDPSYKQGTLPGEYRFTPGSDFAFAPKWGEVTPFALSDSERFQPGPPFPLAGKQYAQDFNEVKAIGGDGITTPSSRTPDQTQIALFWLEGSPLQWNRITRTVSAARRLSLWENARLFALMNFALADGYIATFDTKYHYKFWRPVTAIREGNSDGNPDTVADPAWTPLAITPPIPDYDSGHSVEGGAAAQILEDFFGTDSISFSTCSTTLPVGSNCNDANAVSRHYTSFSQAAEENGESRILVGFHFRDAVTTGIKHGRKLAHWEFTHVLRPAH